MGKTNVPPYAGDWQADNPIFGRSNNPWNLERTPGGSTGGGAAALAAGLSALEFGSDIGGSIRVPAAFCGVYGHRPSDSTLPRSGHFPGAPLPNPTTVLSVLGPLARDAGDLELALDVIAGPDVGEDVAWQLHLPPARHERLQDYRVAVMPSLPWLPVDGEILAAQANLVEKLRRLGVQVKEAFPEELGDLREYYKLYRRLLFVMTTIEMSWEARQEFAANERQSGDEFLQANADGLQASAQEYIIWNARRERYRAIWRRFFREWNILLLPVDIVPAFPHMNQSWEERFFTIDGRRITYESQTVYASVPTLAGHPSTAFPVGLTHTALPVGLQAMGPYLEDRTPLRFAQLVAREWGGFQQPPGFA